MNRYASFFKGCQLLHQNTIVEVFCNCSQNRKKKTGMYEAQVMNFKDLSLSCCGHLVLMLFRPLHHLASKSNKYAISLLLSISDVRGQALFSARFTDHWLQSVVQKLWSRDNIFVALRFAKHRSCNAILGFPTDWLSHVSPFFVEVQRKERCPLQYNLRSFTETTSKDVKCIE